MNEILRTMGLSQGSAKPRSTGLTMVLDKSLGIHGAIDLVETAAGYIDTIKLGWGTCALYPDEVLAKKIKIYRDAGINVCPGGTFIESIFEFADVDTMLDLLKALGFNAIEVSNGIHPSMTLSDKQVIIKKAVAKGFYTISEVGKKLPEEDRKLTYRHRVEEIKQDIQSGVSKVIMEARESGTVGIFNADGRINSELAYELFRNVDPDSVLWEAPAKEQQVWLLQNIGSNVNIGNVSPLDVLSLESMRRGLRADTFRDFCKDSRRVFLELGVGGALRAQRRGDVVVVVDALRASVTIEQCIANGAREVIPVTSATDLVGEVTIGERGGSKLPNADYGNSPLLLSADAVKGRSVVISTTNGTECIRSATGEDSVVLVGALTNCSAVAHAAVEIAAKLGKSITLLAAGRNNQPAIEDRAAVTEIMKKIGNVTPRGVLEPYYSSELEKDFLESDSGLNLVSLGYMDDVVFCSKIDVSAAVPIFDGKRLIKYHADMFS